MAIIKRLCAYSLALVLLVPAISFHDDAIRLSAFLANEGPIDDALAVKGHFQESDYDSVLAILLDGLESINVGSFCSLYLDAASTPCVLIESADSCSRSIAAPVGRAPPSA